MPLLCNLRRQRPSEAQLDLFSSMFGAEAVAPVIVPELPTIIAEPPFAEPEATPAMADTTEQTTIVECDPFIKYISGLNVMSNLQMLPRIENHRKYNKFVCGPDYTIPPYVERTGVQMIWREGPQTGPTDAFECL